MDKVVDFLVRLREAKGNTTMLVDLQSEVQSFSSDFESYMDVKYGRFDDSPAYYKDKQERQKS